MAETIEEPSHEEPENEKTEVEETKARHGHRGSDGRARKTRMTGPSRRKLRTRRPGHVKLR